MTKQEVILENIKKRKNEEDLIAGKIGATIKLKRKEKQQTLNNLSELFGVSISYLSKIENDLMKPNFDYLTDVLDDLEINEDVVHASLEMNHWYKELLYYLLGISNCKKELEEIILIRDDFQAKLFEFALIVHESNFSQVPKVAKSLLQNISVMHKSELVIFLLSLCDYYIAIENHFAAGEILKELDESYFINPLLRLWQLKIKHELALFQPSILYYLKVVSKLERAYINFNLLKEVKDLRERKVAALAYFMEPDEFKGYLEDEEMYKSYRLSHIYFKKYENFESLEKRNDLAQLLFNEINGKYNEVEKKWDKVEYREDPFEQALKEYFKYKYDFKNIDLFLQETMFASTGLSQHYYCSHFIADKLIENFSKEHKYKQCYLINEKLKDLDLRRTKTLQNIKFI